MAETYDDYFQEAILEFMTTTGWSAEDVARLCSRSVHTIYSWRTGRKRPMKRYALHLMTMFDTITDKLEKQA